MPERERIVVEFTRGLELASRIRRAAAAKEELGVGLAGRRTRVEEAGWLKDPESLAEAGFSGCEVALGFTDLRKRQRHDGSRLGMVGRAVVRAVSA